MANNESKKTGKSSSKKSGTNSKKKSEEIRNIKLGDGVLDSAKSRANEKLTDLANVLVDRVIDYLVEKGQELPQNIRQKLKDKKTIDGITTIWSEYLFENALVPEAYSGLTDEMLIHNFKQEGYNDGMFAGLIITISALIDNDAPKELVRNTYTKALPSLLGHSYEDKEELKEDFETNAKYNWLIKHPDTNRTDE